MELILQVSPDADIWLQSVKMLLIMKSEVASAMGGNLDAGFFASWCNIWHERI